MNDWVLLIPTPKIAAVIGASIAATLGVASSLNDVAVLTSVITAAAVIVLGGLFTLRNNLKTFWKNQAEELAEKIKIMDVKAEEAMLERANFAEEQRDIRHQLKTRVATLEGQLEVERSKHDLSSVLNRIDDLEQTLDNRAPLINEIAATLAEQTKALNELVAEIKKRPLATAATRPKAGRG